MLWQAGTNGYRSGENQIFTNFEFISFILFPFFSTDMGGEMLGTPSQLATPDGASTTNYDIAQGQDSMLGVAHDDFGSFFLLKFYWNL